MVVNRIFLKTPTHWYNLSVFYKGRRSSTNRISLAMKCTSSAPYWNRDYRKLDETGDSLIRAAMSQTCTERSSACASTASTVSAHAEDLSKYEPFSAWLPPHPETLAHNCRFGGE
jgi:hypothetical protein